MTAGGPWSVIVADDHPLYRDAVAEAVSQHAELELVEAADDGRSALDAVRRLRPDVAVLDMRMPDVDGLDVLRAVIREELPTRILFLTAHLEGGIAYEVLACGAAGLLSKSEEVDAISEAVVAVARGGTVLPPAMHGTIAREIRLRTKVDDSPPLSAREQEVLRLAADGCTGPEIARRLYLSPGTVKTHLSNLYRKLDVSDRAAAVAEAMRRGLLD